MLSLCTRPPPQKGSLKPWLQYPPPPLFHYSVSRPIAKQGFIATLVEMPPPTWPKYRSREERGEGRGGRAGREELSSLASTVRQIGQAERAKGSKRMRRKRKKTERSRQS